MIDQRNYQNMSCEEYRLIRRTERRVWLILFMFAVLFGGLLIFSMFGCSVPVKFPITQNTSLTTFETGLWGYQQDLRHPDRAVKLPACQGIAAREYYQLKAKGYDACIMAGSLNGAGHVQASVLKNGIPLDLLSMQTTHILTESGIWRIQN